MEIFKNLGINCKEVPNYWNGNCFGCSRTNLDGLKLPIYFSEMKCHSYTSIPEKFCGFEGLVHGGIIATLLDEIAAWTIIVHLFKVGVTQEANIRYLKPIKTNIPIILEGLILTQKEDNTIITKATINNLENEILAECESKWLLPDFKVLEKITGKKASEIEDLLNIIVKPLIKKSKE